LVIGLIAVSILIVYNVVELREQREHDERERFYEMTAAEKLIYVVGCNEEQAQHIIYTLVRVNIGTILDIWPRDQYGWHFVFTAPEGEFSLTVNEERELTAIRSPIISCTVSSMLTSLYLNQVTNTCDLYPDGRFMDDVIRRILPSSYTEREYYFDITNAMITSIQDYLVIQEYEISHFGVHRTPVGEYEVPTSFDIGEWFVSQRVDVDGLIDVGIVDVAFVIYADTDGEPIPVRFDVEFAMLHPVSLILNVYGDNPQFIYDVWNSSYYYEIHEIFDELRDAAANRKTPFTEDEVNHARHILNRFINDGY